MTIIVIRSRRCMLYEEGGRGGKLETPKALIRYNIIIVGIQTSGVVIIFFILPSEARHPAPFSHHRHIRFLFCKLYALSSLRVNHHLVSSHRQQGGRHDNQKSEQGGSSISRSSSTPADLHCPSHSAMPSLQQIPFGGAMDNRISVQLVVFAQRSAVSSSSQGEDGSAVGSGPDADVAGGKRLEC